MEQDLMSEPNNKEKMISSQQSGFEAPGASNDRMFGGLPPGGGRPPDDLGVNPAAAANDNPPQAAAKNKGWLKSAFFNACVVGASAAVAYGVKTCAFAFLCASSPVAAIGVTMLASAVSGGIVGAARYGLNKARGQENDDSLGQSIWKGAYRSTLWGLVFGAAFGSFDVYKPVVSAPADVAPLVPPAGAIVEPELPVETDSLAELKGMSAQQIKDEAVRLFNDGNPGNDEYAIRLFNRAAEMGNHGAKVDLAYIQHWGLAGVPKDDFGSIDGLYNALEDMDKAGVSHNPDFSHKPEYGRGYDLLDQWLGVQHEPIDFDAIAEGNDVTREILECETLPQTAVPTLDR